MDSKATEMFRAHLERRLIAGLIVGGPDGKGAVSGLVTYADFTSSILGMIYWLVMAVPPIEDEPTFKRFLTAYHYAFEDMPVATVYLYELIEEVDTVDPIELATLAAGIRQAALYRRGGADVIGDIAAVLISRKGEPVPYHVIVAAVQDEVITQRVINTGLKIMIKRGAVEMKSEGGVSLWRLVEMAAEENEIEAEAERIAA